MVKINTGASGIDNYDNKISGQQKTIEKDSTVDKPVVFSKDSQTISQSTNIGIPAVVPLDSLNKNNPVPVEKPISQGFFGPAVDKANNLAGDIAYPFAPDPNSQDKNVLYPLSSEVVKERIGEFKDSIKNLNNEDKKTVARWVNGLMSFSDSTNLKELSEILSYNIDSIQPQKSPSVNQNKINEINGLINELYQVKEIPKNMDVDASREINLNNKLKKLNNQEAKEVAKLIPPLMENGNTYQRAHIRFIFDGSVDNIKTVKSVIKKAVDNTLNINQPVG